MKTLQQFSVSIVFFSVPKPYTKFTRRRTNEPTKRFESDDLRPATNVRSKYWVLCDEIEQMMTDV